MFGLYRHDCMIQTRNEELTLIFSLLITYTEITLLQIAMERILFQMAPLGFCLNVSLNNESTNLRVSQIVI